MNTVAYYFLSKELFSSQVSWAILIIFVLSSLLWFHTVQHDPPLGGGMGEFLNFDISLSPSRRGKLRT